MRKLILLAAALFAAGCASPLPPHDPGQAWVELRSDPGSLLMADRLDDQRLNDGRYFQLSPGAHELQVRFQYEINGGGGMDGMSEPLQITCQMRLRYANFAAGQRYRVEARPLVMKAQSWLYDEQRNVLARGQVLRCGTF
ncbi:hypothetical protein [Pseudomonas sp.]|uniref:PA0061/PA0062 family lipoprotein n=1 Tax=Pseudomonas sp. TaxID=306 RepID=UPI003C75D375